MTHTLLHTDTYGAEVGDSPIFQFNREKRMLTVRVHRQGELCWAMSAHTLGEIDTQLQREAHFFQVGDKITIRENRRIIRQETIGPVFHGWDTTRPRLDT